jgi:hypothetical protein
MNAAHIKALEKRAEWLRWATDHSYEEPSTEDGSRS